MAVLGWFAGRAFVAPRWVILRRPDGTSRTVGARTPVVTVTGPPGELLLFAFGRQDHARVDLDGEPDAVAALRHAPLRW